MTYDVDSSSIKLGVTHKFDFNSVLFSSSLNLHNHQTISQLEKRLAALRARHKQEALLLEAAILKEQMKEQTAGEPLIPGFCLLPF